MLIWIGFPGSKQVKALTEVTTLEGDVKMNEQLKIENLEVGYDIPAAIEWGWQDFRSGKFRHDDLNNDPDAHISELF